MGMTRDGLTTLWGKFMSQPNIEAEKAEYEEELKREIAQEVGMVYSGRNSDNEMEWIGTEKQWKGYTRLLEDKLQDL